MLDVVNADCNVVMQRSAPLGDTSQQSMLLKRVD